MDVPGRVIRVQNESFHVRRAEMEHARFMMINPNHCMIVMLAHGINPLCCDRMFIRDPDPGPSMNQCRVGRIAGARIAACRPAPFASHASDPEGSELRPLPRH